MPVVNPSRLVVLALSVTAACNAFQESPSEILARVQQNTAAQLAQSSNYTCVQTIVRTYYGDEYRLPLGCATKAAPRHRLLVMRDRLRLDVAVSQGQEIYSWHGENKFSTSQIDEVVKHGPISSGSFIGFLRNIFLTPGVEFNFEGSAKVKNVPTYSFRYSVSASRSAYHVQAPGRRPVVPFHGVFTVDGNTFELATLNVIVDAIPEDSEICSAQTDVQYQMVNIAGKPSLLPATFRLWIDTQSHTYTSSENTYSACREYRGESQLRFDSPSASVSEAAPTPTAPEELLPAGLILPVALRTPIDDKSSYTGDPVEGVLTQPVSVPGLQQTLPRGAVLEGIISKLAFRTDPWKHYVVSIEFVRLTYPGHLFRLLAWPKTSQKDVDKLMDVYESRLPPDVSADVQSGVFVITSSHFHLDSRFAGDWVTAAPK
jgi:hypothetical protein